MFNVFLSYVSTTATGGVKDEDVLVLSLDMTHYHLHQSSFDAVISHFGQVGFAVGNLSLYDTAIFVCLQCL